MLRLHCPFCGERPETEFQCAGEATRRPDDPGALDEAAWSHVLYQRANPSGWTLELWWHVAGCRQWLRVERHTLTHDIGSITVAGEAQ
ncbi:MAG: sarcosine oxidase subunit delta [Burkholderiaceae bacterium]|jgi:sarcosine oxidase subunit delta